jgi:hypothetical protein
MTIIKYILSLIVLVPNHPLNRDTELRKDVAGYFEKYGEQYDVDPTLLVNWGYREASLRIDRVGTRGEIGICQAHGKHLRTCKAAGLDVKTWEGGIHCMAMLIDMDRRWCGSLEGGLRRYSTGSCYRGKKFVRRRLKAWKRSMK